MEKVRPGQALLYKGHGDTGIIIEVQLKDDVDEHALNDALDLSLDRFPYIAGKLIENEGGLFIEQDPISMRAVQTDKLMVLGAIDTGYHLVHITYQKNKFKVAFHHSFCDGRGIKPFVETLTYYYCKLRYQTEIDATGVRLSTSPMFPGESIDPMDHDIYDTQTPITPVIYDYFTLPDAVSWNAQTYRFKLDIDQPRFIQYAKENNATPAILVALIVSDTIAEIHPNADKTILCSMATDYRKEIGLENTYKNCLGTVKLPYTQEVKTLSLPDQATRYRTVLKQQKTNDAVKEGLNSQIRFYRELDNAESKDVPGLMMGFLGQLAANTFSISYLGQISLGGAAEYVDSIHFYSNGTRGLLINILSAGKTLGIDFLQGFATTRILDGFTSVLKNANIPYKLSTQNL